MLYGNIYSGYKSVKPRYVNYKIVHGTNLFAKVFNLEVLCRFLSDTSAKIELIHLERIFEMLRRQGTSSQNQYCYLDLVI